jgi:DNA anti-recombination protein RmuC
MPIAKKKLLRHDENIIQKLALAPFKKIKNITTFFGNEWAKNAIGNMIKNYDFQDAETKLQVYESQDYTPGSTRFEINNVKTEINNLKTKLTTNNWVYTNDIYNHNVLKKELEGFQNTAIQKMIKTAEEFGNAELQNLARELSVTIGKSQTELSKQSSKSQINFKRTITEPLEKTIKKFEQGLIADPEYLQMRQLHDFMLTMRNYHSGCENLDQYNGIIENPNFLIKKCAEFYRDSTESEIPSNIMQALGLTFQDNHA